MNDLRTQATDLGPVIVDIEGCELTSAERELLCHPLVGGLILFSRNFSSLQQLHALVASIRLMRSDLLLSVDQEGGRVQRFTAGFTRLPPMQQFWRSNPNDIEPLLPLVRDCGWLMASEILASDIDISFAPVLDVDDDHCPVIGNRSFSPDPEQVVSLADAFIEGMHEAGMAVTGKHFPGHGGVTEDSHLSLPVDQRSFEQIQGRDWQPFARLIERLDGVMPAHLVIPAVDHQSVGFSRVWLQDMLRVKLGFTGVIFSDDLTMEGAAIAGGYGDRAVSALNAGCDVVLVCNNRAGALEVIKRLEQENILPNNVLASMRKHKNVPWAQLKADPRWENTRNQLAALVKSAQR